MRRSVTLTVALLLACSGIASAQPANDDCTDATPIGSLPFSDAVDTSAATTEAGDPTFECDSSSYGQEARSVWYRYFSAGGGPIEIDTFGSDYDTIVTVWRGSCGSLGDLASCNDDDWDSSYFGDQSRLVATVGAGETVYVEVASGGAAGGNLVLNVQASSVFQVTDDAAYFGKRPDAAAAADGTFVVVWDEYLGYAIMGRRFCDTGVPVGPPFLISDTGYPSTARIVRSGDEGFVVVWMDDDTLQGRRLDATGAPVGSQFEVANDFLYYEDFGLAGDPAGRFVVVWTGYGDGDHTTVWAQRVDAANAPLGTPFVVNTSTAGDQIYPSVAADPAGNFVVTWEGSTGGYAEFDVFGQRFDASAAPAGGEFQVNVTTTNRQSRAAVAAQPDGGFIVSWHDESSDACDDYCVMGRRYDAGGTPQGGEFLVSDGTGGQPSYYPTIDVDTSGSGDFIVAWSDELDYPRARAFDADGTPQAPSFRASVVEDGYQRNVRVAVADDGDFVVVWDWAPQGSHYKIMARSQVANPSCPVEIGGCPATPRTGCKQPTLEFKGGLTLKDKTPDSHDAAIWKWVKGEATSPGEIGDALATDSYTFCLYDAANALLAAATVPPGGTCGITPCWKDLHGLGFKYADKAGEHGVVRKLVVKSGDAGRAKVIVKAQGDGLTLGALPPALPVRAQLASTTGVCWEGLFDTGGVTKSTPTVFGAKVSLGSPGGAFVDGPG